MKPILGIMACNRTVGTENAHAVMERYTRTVSRLSDCQPLLLPPIVEGLDPGAVASVVDGFLFTGSPSNVGPHHYGDESEGDGPFDPERDSVAFRMTKALLARSKPVFGICRGFQELNVYFGGSLRRDVGHAKEAFGLSHHAKDGASYDEMFTHDHEVSLTEDGVLAKLYGVSSMRVNSVHYQGVDRLGEGLKVEAVAADGLVEAFSATVNGARILAVQWHPEYTGYNLQHSEIFFQSLSKSLRQHQGV